MTVSSSDLLPDARASMMDVGRALNLRRGDSSDVPSNAVLLLEAAERTLSVAVDFLERDAKAREAVK